MTFPAFVVAAARSGSGKTTFTTGLLRALALKGHRVQPFKVGPDFIDPSYLAAAAGRSCRNLDGHLLGASTLTGLFEQGCRGADVAVVEGVMGLYDGLGPEGLYSTAWTARCLGLPVLLLVDASAGATSVAAIVHGFATLPVLAPSLVAVVLNRVGSDGHGEMVAEAVRDLTGLPVLGWLPKMPEAAFPSRHLGLIPAGEREGLSAQINRLGQAVLERIDLARLLALASDRKVSRGPSLRPFFPLTDRPLRVAYGWDQAFSFYYRDALDLLEVLGAELVPTSPLGDEDLPEGTEALFLGGGYPEVFLDELAENAPYLASLRSAHGRGLPIYAECGGMIYLGRSLTDEKGQKRPLAGLLELDTVMTDRLQRFGYVHVDVLEKTVLQQKGIRLPGHEFHYSAAAGALPDAYRVSRAGRESSSWSEGYRSGNLLASYVHLHFWSDPSMAERFLRFALERRTPHGR